MSKVLKEVLEANRKYSGSFGEKGKLGLPPARRFAILTCMDARMDPAKFAGLAEGDAHVIRNAGGRASDDAVTSVDCGLVQDWPSFPTTHQGVAGVVNRSSSRHATR